MDSEPKTATAESATAESATAPEKATTAEKLAAAESIGKPTKPRKPRKAEPVATPETAAADQLSDETAERQAAQQWIEAGVERLLSVWERSGERYARRLLELDHPGDPLDDLLTLAARRVVPLPAPRRRGLPRTGLAPATVALCRLARPDRRALRGALDGRDLDEAQRDHAAAAMWRLVERVRAARRWNDAPPAKTPGDSSEGTARIS